MNDKLKIVTVILKITNKLLSKQKYILKNNCKFFVTVTLLLNGFFYFGNLYSQPMMTSFDEENKSEIKSKQWLDIRLGAEFPSASMRYDKDANEVLEDTLHYTDTAAVLHKYRYTTDLNQQKYYLQLGYIGIENFYLYAKFPFAYASIIEKFNYDSSITVRYTKDEDSKFYVEGSQINAGYRFNFDFFNINLLGELFFPFYKYDGNADNSNIDSIGTKTIKLGRTFETSIGTKFDFNLKPIKLELAGLYNSRAEGFSDRFLFNFFVGLASIEDTELYANFVYSTPIGDYQEKFNIDFWRQTLWEKYFDTNIGFKVFFNDDFYANISYTVRMWGENTLAFRTVNVNLGYILQK
jgi:hypothetical protein